ncbi:iron ABC transporter substrate-binding protein [Mycolicibacterium chitae]|uniref:ABC transporter-iron, periplasmic substrate-binding protein n=1 Tax=Mycolicibacterium chitae TaxID=1792 RepID=A0A448IC85_MYCCI|nr:ABC transporter substrate-binding protein [Mycolicibacterium chitae]MCV7106984.1 ABC transporter substrate-binding protein [Mycolicibacterium chitae]BBZ01226.1 iron ABC transporter substrate-binding protein [Mycolicibacterium chitae]VEG50066.1 ABC transporter-iron, periplasmic substrate-binding protein [Mycolicibacterium chitae]
MQTQCSRRGFLALTGAAGLLLATACESGSDSDAADGAVTITHAFGETTIPARPTRVVSAGFTEQDSLLALGLVPIATTEWWGEQPFAVWPWAQPALGGAQPVVLSLTDGIDVDQIASLTPDLIVAINAGCDADTYARLSAIAPTVPQSGPAPFFEPWKEQAATLGRAAFAADQMDALIAAVDDGFTAAGAAHPQFQDKKVLLLQGSTYWENSVLATKPGWRTDFLTQLGFTISEAIAPFGREHDHRAYIPLPEIGPVLDDADVLIWTTESDEDRARLLADPNIAALRATRENRNVFTTKDLTGAIAFSSVLSYPLVAEQLPPLLAAALT